MPEGGVAVDVLAVTDDDETDALAVPRARRRRRTNACPLLGFGQANRFPTSLAILGR
jgi:hypothetical protein